MAHGKPMFNWPSHLPVCLHRWKTVLEVSDPWLEYCGFERKEVVGSDLSMLQGPLTDQREVQRLMSAVWDGKPVTVTLINYKKNRTPFFNKLTVTPVFDLHTFTLFEFRDFTGLSFAVPRMIADNRRGLASERAPEEEDTFALEETHKPAARPGGGSSGIGGSGIGSGPGGSGAARGARPDSPLGPRQEAQDQRPQESPEGIVQENYSMYPSADEAAEATGRCAPAPAASSDSTAAVGEPGAARAATSDSGSRSTPQQLSEAPRAATRPDALADAPSGDGGREAGHADSTDGALLSHANNLPPSPPGPPSTPPAPERAVSPEPAAEAEPSSSKRPRSPAEAGTARRGQRPRVAAQPMWPQPPGPSARAAAAAGLRVAAAEGRRHRPMQNTRHMGGHMGGRSVSPMMAAQDGEFDLMMAWQLRRQMASRRAALSRGPRAALSDRGRSRAPQPHHAQMDVDIRLMEKILGRPSDGPPLRDAHDMMRQLSNMRNAPLAFGRGASSSAADRKSVV